MKKMLPRNKRQPFIRGTIAGGLLLTIILTSSSLAAIAAMIGLALLHRPTPAPTLPKRGYRIAHTLIRLLLGGILLLAVLQHKTDWVTYWLRTTLMLAMAVAVFQLHAVWLAYMERKKSSKEQGAGPEAIY